MRNIKKYNRYNPDYYQKADIDLFLDQEVKELSMMAVGYYAIMENVDIQKAKKSLNITKT